MDSISSARISMALTSHRDVAPKDAQEAPGQGPTTPGTANPEGHEEARGQGADPADPTRALREKARQEKEEYQARLEQENRETREFSEAFHKLNERPILLPQTVQETDRQVHQEDLDSSLEKDQLQGKLDLVRRQMEEAQAGAGDPSASWESRRQMLVRSRGLINEHLSTLGGLMDRYHEKFQDFVGAEDGMKARLEIEDRMTKLDSQREFLENYYDLLGGIAGKGEGRNSLASLASRADGIDPGLAQHPEDLARRKRQEAA